MDAADFSEILLWTASGTLPFLASGVAAGALIFALVFGIKKGIYALRFMSWNRASDRGDM